MEEKSGGLLDDFCKVATRFFWHVAIPRQPAAHLSRHFLWVGIPVTSFAGEPPRARNSFNAATDVAVGTKWKYSPQSLKRCGMMPKMP